MEITAAITFIAMAFVMGAYLVTQIDKKIDNNIEKNIEEYEKKKAKQQKSKVLVKRKTRRTKNKE